MSSGIVVTRSAGSVLLSITGHRLGDLGLTLAPMEALILSQILADVSQEILADPSDGDKKDDAKTDT